MLKPASWYQVGKRPSINSITSCSTLALVRRSPNSDLALAIKSTRSNW
ncbi:Uncharacterised protein [Vibrio cholerae]|nr:Uncharacterised protein [Vibrio cholerae]